MYFLKQKTPPHVKKIVFQKYLLINGWLFGEQIQLSSCGYPITLKEGTQSLFLSNLPREFSKQKLSDEKMNSVTSIIYLPFKMIFLKIKLCIHH